MSKETEARLIEAEQIIASLVDAIRARGWSTAESIPEFREAVEFVSPSGAGLDEPESLPASEDDPGPIGTEPQISGGFPFPSRDPALD